MKCRGAAGGGWVTVGGAVRSERWPHGVRHTSGHLAKAAVQQGWCGVMYVVCG